jgi:hypothetical protein
MQPNPAPAAPPARRRCPTTAKRRGNGRPAQAAFRRENADQQSAESGGTAVSDRSAPRDRRDAEQRRRRRAKPAIRCAAGRAAHVLDMVGDPGSHFANHRLRNARA